MKVEARVFDIVAIFGIVIAIIYAVMTGIMTQDGVEPVGTVALLLSGGLALLVGSYFRFVARRIEPRPEDHEDAEISDGAGELGFFSPGSYWPVVVAAGCALVRGSCVLPGVADHPQRHLAGHGDRWLGVRVPHRTSSPVTSHSSRSTRAGHRSAGAPHGGVCRPAAPLRRVSGCDVLKAVSSHPKWPKRLSERIVGGFMRAWQPCGAMGSATPKGEPMWARLGQCLLIQRSRRSAAAPESMALAAVSRPARRSAVRSSEKPV